VGPGEVTASEMVEVRAWEEPSGGYPTKSCLWAVDADFPLPVVTGYIRSVTSSVRKARLPAAGVARMGGSYWPVAAVRTSPHDKG
jgi:hypothetical protein